MVSADFTRVPGEKRRISITQGVFTQCNSILGVSIMTYPYTYGKLGYLLSTFFIIFMCICSSFTLYFLAKCSHEINAFNFDETISHVVGKFGSFVCTFILYLACLLPLIFYLQISVDFYSDILEHGGFENHRVLVGLITAILCFIICLTYNKVETMNLVSLISIFSLFIFILYIFYDFFICLGYVNFKKLKKAELNCESLCSLSFIIFGFMSHSTIIPISACLESVKEANYVIGFANLIATFFYIVTGFIGFAIHPSSERNYLLNEGGNCSLKYAVMFFLSSVNILSFPLMMIPATRNLKKLLEYIFHLRETNFLRNINILLNVATSLLIVLIMKKMDILECLFFIIGALIMFLMPCFLFLKIEKKFGKGVDFYIY